MRTLYNFAIFIFGIVIQIMALFNHKIKLFVEGRRESFPKLMASIESKDKTIWIHCASLGEFEQGRPIIEALYKATHTYKIILTFYSPSGFEVQKNYEFADVIAYLPIDSVSNAKKFVEICHPSMAIFVKYEFWPNMLQELKQNEIPTILISGVFRKEQLFFKSYGAWMRNALGTFTHFFVQNKASKRLLESITLTNTTISGDTRFDRVASILNQDNNLDFLNDFTNDKIVMVSGSTWPIDEAYLIQYINQQQHENVRFIIAPHNINKKNIIKLQKAINIKTVLFSEGKPDPEAKVLIIDTVGLLTKIYSYADFAYVGGGFEKEGVHNVLEPAVYGIPLVIGPIYEKFEEAKDLVELKGCLVANTNIELKPLFESLITESKFRISLGKITENYIQDNLGATKIILDYIHDKVNDIS
jgi:3-deoxy-D-manno-octulosonic-acid transferase